MKPKQISICTALFVGLLLGLSGCSDMLDKAPDGRLSLDEVFADNDKVAAYLNSCYRFMPAKGKFYYWWERGPACWSDDAWDADDVDVSWAFSSRMYRGDGSADNHPILTASQPDFSQYNNSNYWNNYWAGIHDCSVFIDRLNKPETVVTNAQDRSRWAAEAHLLRAYYYSELVKWFGCGLPLVDKPLNYDSNFSNIAKADYYTTVKFIMSDCDAALSCPDLPWRISNSGEVGRLPKALAWAIKSRMMLYAASPLYNDGKNHWEEAYQVTKEAMEKLSEVGYGLYNTLYDTQLYAGANSFFGPDDYPAQMKRFAGIYNELFQTSVEATASPRENETIFETNFVEGQTITIEGIGGQNGFKSGACPSQEIVDCFETINGKTILNMEAPYKDPVTHLKPNYNADNEMYDPNNPYVNRDPRFYASIYYNGAKRYTYWPNAEEPAAKENYPAAAGRRVRKIMTYTGEPVTGRSATVRYLTRTGYFMRKFTDPQVGLDNHHGTAKFKDFRYAEMLLNFAEAACQTNRPDEARMAVNLVRARVGMPALPDGLEGNALLLRIKNERRVEFCFEEQRFFDVRRWTAPDGNLEKTDRWLTAAIITRNADGTFTYERGPVGNERNCWQNKWLKVAIPMKEANIISAIQGTDVNWQNSGW